MARSVRYLIFAFPFILLSVLLSACVGPLVVQETARTVGYHNSELVGGAGTGGYYGFKYNFGVGEKFDVGVEYETLNFGLRAKYAFLNNQSLGWSAAVAGGTGITYGGSYSYADAMASYLFGVLEPFGTFRLVYVSISPSSVTSSNSSNIVFTINGSSYDYGEAVVGTRVWLTKNWLLSLEAETLIAVTNGVGFSNSVLWNGSLGYRF